MSTILGKQFFPMYNFNDAWECLQSAELLKFVSYQPIKCIFLVQIDKPTNKREQNRITK